MTTLEELEALLAAPEPARDLEIGLDEKRIGDDEPAPRMYTDAGNGEMFATQHHGDLRWSPEWGSWLRWGGSRWERTPSESIIPLAIKAVRSLYAVAADPAMDHDERAKLIRHAQASESVGRLEAMIRIARGHMVALSTEFDRDAFAFNCGNGTIDLRTGELREHRREDMITMLAPVEYDPNATCPQWERFLARVLPDADVRAWVQRYAGYCLTGDVGEQVLAFWFGRGANGKSTAIEVLLSVLGEYARTAAPDLLLAKTNDAHPTEQADLKGARMVVAQEVEAGRAWAEKTIKQLTGGDTIKARLMHRDFFEFKPTHKLVIAANHRPKVRGTDEGIWRRIRLVPFNVTIPASERDPYLVRKLIADESPGILAWAVRGCLAWQRDRLGVPAAVSDATAAYRDEQDHLARFVEDVCELVPDAFAATSALYAAYTSWCTRSGDRPWSRDAFREGLLEHAAWKLADARRRDARGIKGVQLRTHPITVPILPSDAVTPGDAVSPIDPTCSAGDSPSGDAGDAGDAVFPIVATRGFLLSEQPENRSSGVTRVTRP